MKLQNGWKIRRWIFRITRDEKLNQKRIEKKRLEAYLGSSMHFIRSLYNDKLQEEGFNVRELIKSRNPEYPSDVELEKIMVEVKLTNDYSLIRKLTGNTIDGWTFLSISIWFIGGIQMISIGIIGEYIGKVYSETKARPRFIISENLEEK